MGLNWQKDKARRQGRDSIRSQGDAESYVREADKTDDLLGWVWLTCPCGHYGRIYNKPHRKFRCSKCSRLWKL